MERKNSINDRVIQAVEHIVAERRVKKAEIAEQVHMRPSTFSDVLKKRMNAGTDIVSLLSSSYGIDPDWLLTGEGEMLRDESKPRKSYTKGVPYVDADFAAGFDVIFTDAAGHAEYLIDFKPYNRADCWCNVTGHSMEPEISNGDIVALQRVDDPSFLLAGEIYAIALTNGMRTVKRLGAGTRPGTYLLIPSNKSPEYTSQEIDREMIAQVFRVLGCMKRF